MLKLCVIVIFLGLVPRVHLFKTNTSVTIYQLVDELSNYIKSEDRESTSWPSGNHILGLLHRIAIHHRYCGDFSSISLKEEPLINATYHKHRETMVYKCIVVLYMNNLHFGFVLDMNFIGQNWDSSDVIVHARENAWEVVFDVHVRKDGFCRVKFIDSAILYLGNYEVTMEPPDHWMRKMLLVFLARSFVWGYFHKWNDMLKDTVQEEIKSMPITNMICQAFTSEEPENYTP